jgi:two-component system, LytTR family, sensor kinase
MNSKKILEPLIHIIIWLGLYTLAVIFFRTIGPFRSIDGTLIIPVTFGTIVNALIFYIISLYLVPRLALKGKIKEFLFQTIIVVTSLSLIETLIDFFFLIYMYSSEDEPFLGQLLTNGLIHFMFASVALGYGFTRNWLINEKKKQELQKEKMSAELNFLKSQLNPHFLFNVLNMAYSSASQVGDERTADIIEKLSGLMRYMIYESNVEKVEAEREIEYIGNYINLQKMRLSADIPVSINFNVVGNPAGLRIAPLILISFIENAFKFGLKLEKKTEIDISLAFTNGKMEFKTFNQIYQSSNSMSEKSSGIGIANTRKRLEILYPGKHNLEINNNGKEFMVKLILDLS